MDLSVIDKQLNVQCSADAALFKAQISGCCCFGTPYLAENSIYFSPERRQTGGLIKLRVMVDPTRNNIDCVLVPAPQLHRHLD